MNDLSLLLAKEGITEYGIIDFRKLNVINKKLLPDEEINSAMMVLTPYKHNSCMAQDGFNAGLFARCMDYHKYFDDLFARVIPNLRNLAGGNVYGFADHSPIHEKDAAAKCGLGFIGKNSLLINRKYGSFVFIGTLLFTSALDEYIHHIESGCGNCDACIQSCPQKAIHDSVDITRCLSALSQKRKKNDSDIELLCETKTVWGCDICQNVCPYNKNAEASDIDYFKKGFITNFSDELINNMSENEYKSRAFSFRERKVIVENILTAMNNRGIINTK